jgi:hypothetical protein
MGRAVSYFFVALGLGIAGLVIYATFADLPAPQSPVEVPVIVDVSG